MKLRLPEAIGRLVVRRGKASCAVCKRTFGNKETLALHLLASHINPCYTSCFHKRKANSRRGPTPKPKSRAVFICSICKFGTNSLNEIQKHVNDCKPIVKVEGRESIAEAPPKKRNRTDYLSSLEQAEDPQSVFVPDYGAIVAENKKYIQGIISEQNQTVAAADAKPNKRRATKKQSVLHPTDLYFKDFPPPLSIIGETRGRTAYFCASCYQVFHSFEILDQHLNDRDCKCTSAPLTVSMQSGGNLPVSMGVEHRMPKFVLSDRNSHLKCTGCKKKNFATVSLFHEHLVSCGRARFRKLATQKLKQNEKRKVVKSRQKANKRNGKKKKVDANSGVKIEIVDDDYEQEF